MTWIIMFSTIVGLIVGTIKGWQVGEGHGRVKEKRQVLAFLMHFRNDEKFSAEELAKRIDNGEHKRWDLVQR